MDEKCAKEKENEQEKQVWLTLLIPLTCSVYHTIALVVNVISMCEFFFAGTGTSLQAYECNGSAATAGNVQCI